MEEVSEGPFEGDILGYVSRRIDQSWNSAIDMYRRIIVCIPKGLAGVDPISRLTNPRNVSTVVLYTLTYKTSTFMQNLLHDRTLHTKFDIYFKDVIPSCGYYNQDRWLAEAGVYFILHSHLNVPIRNITYEFIFDYKLGTLITSSILHQFVDMQDVITRMIPLLRSNKLFCLEDCTIDCETDSFSGHVSLSGLQSFDAEEDIILQEHLQNYMFLFNPEIANGHPLQELLRANFQQYPAFTVEEKVRNVIATTLAKFNTLDLGYTAYILLLVTRNDGQVAHLNNLLPLWEARAAQFELYVGSTCQFGYRKEHVSGTGRTGVSTRMKPHSKLFIVHSERCASYEEARKKEALYIDLVKVDLILDLKCNRTSLYKLINVRSERLWISALDRERIRTCIDFVSGGNRLFRLPNEVFVPSENFNFGNYVVQSETGLFFFNGTSYEDNEEDEELFDDEEVMM